MLLFLFFDGDVMVVDDDEDARGYAVIVELLELGFVFGL